MAAELEVEGKFAPLPGAADDNGLADRLLRGTGERLVDRQDKARLPCRGEAGHLRQDGAGAGCNNHKIGLFGADQFGCRLDAEADIDAPLFHHAAMVVRLVAQHFHVRKVRVIARPVHRAAEGSGFLEHDHVVSDLLCGDGVFHAARTAADDDDLLGTIGRYDPVFVLAAEDRVLGRAGPALAEDVALQERGAGMRRQADFVVAAFHHLAREVRIIERQAADAREVRPCLVHHGAQVVRRDEVGRADQGHVDALLDQQLAQGVDVLLVDDLGCVEGRADELGGVTVRPAAGRAQHRAERTVEHSDTERLQARGIVLDEIRDVEAALEILIDAEARDDREILAAEGLRAQDDLLDHQEAVSILVGAALIGEQRQVRVRQRAVAEVKRGEVEAGLARPPGGLAEAFNDVLVFLGRHDETVRIANDVLVAGAPGDGARDPALAGFQRDGGPETRDEAAIEELYAGQRVVVLDFRHRVAELNHIVFVVEAEHPLIDQAVAPDAGCTDNCCRIAAACQRPISSREAPGRIPLRIGQVQRCRNMDDAVLESQAACFERLEQLAQIFSSHAPG